MLKVLIADDSATARQALKYIVQQADGMDVVGEAVNGQQAVEMAENLHPDVILMDIVMPEMDGLEATSEIMLHVPTPIVVVSSTVDGPETETAFQAIRAGALTVLPKPAAIGSSAYLRESKTLQTTIRAMAGVSVIHHRRYQSSRPNPIPVVADSGEAPEIVVMVSSTGGPGALGEIVSLLPADFPLPIVIVQHITPDFLTSMIKWLDMVSLLTVTLAHEGDSPKPGNVYLAPGDTHLLLGRGRRFRFDDQTPASHKPSGDILLKSIAQQFGARAIGIVLTGMGEDGAEGLRALHTQGAYTIAQDEATSAVFGMPRAAIEMGAARRVLPLAEIPAALIELTSSKEILS